MNSGRSQPPTKVLLILTGALGDVCRGLTVATAISRRWPEAQVAWLVDTRWEPLVRLHPGVTRTIPFVRRGTVRQWYATAREVRAFGAQLTLDLQRNFRSGCFSLASGARRRVGFHPADSKEFNHFFNTDYISRFGELQPKIAQYQEFLRHLSIPVPTEYDFGLGAVDPAALLGSLNDLVVPESIAVVLGSSWASKEWFGEGYAGLIQLALREVSGTILLMGDGRTRVFGEQLQGAARSTRVVNLSGQTSILQLVGVLKRSAVVIGPDSGPGHLAAALGTPSVTIMGPTDPIRTAPTGSGARVVQSRVGCAPCGRRLCPGLNRVCMRLISAERVWGEASAALALLRPRENTSM